MRIKDLQYINGEWVPSASKEKIDVINPATEEVIGQVCNGNKEDVNQAVQAAKDAFGFFSKSTVAERIEVLEAIATEYEKRKADIIETVTLELGSPVAISEQSHYAMGLSHFKQAAKGDRKSTRLNSSHV